MNQSSQYTGQTNLAGIVLFSGTLTTAGTTFSNAIGEGQLSNSAMGEWGAILWQLEVTANANVAGDTLDVSIQTTVDGTNWLDMVHFTQVLGNGAVPKRFLVSTSVYQAQAMYEVGTALAAGSIRNLFGDMYRVKSVIVDSGGHAQSFTFSVKANCIGG